VGTREVLGVSEEREVSCPFRDSNPCTAYAETRSPHVFDVC